MRPAAQYDPAQLSSVDARVGALEHRFDQFEAKLDKLFQNLNRPKDWGVFWAAASVVAVLALAGITALSAFTQAGDEALGKDVRNLRESIPTEVQRQIAMDRAAALQVQLADIKSAHAKEIDLERRVSEMRVLLSASLTHSARLQN